MQCFFFFVWLHLLNVFSKTIKKAALNCLIIFVSLSKRKTISGLGPYFHLTQTQQEKNTSSYVSKSCLQHTQIHTHRHIESHPHTQGIEMSPPLSAHPHHRWGRHPWEPKAQTTPTHWLVWGNLGLRPASAHRNASTWTQSRRNDSQSQICCLFIRQQRTEATTFRES